MKICEFGDVAYFRSITASLAESFTTSGVFVIAIPASLQSLLLGIGNTRTTKDVKKGAELITDYGSEYWEESASGAPFSKKCASHCI